MFDKVSKRKVRPVDPGSIIRDILEERDISDLYLYSLELDEILEGERPITFYWAKEMEKHLSILLINLQRKVDIWGSEHETN